MAKRELNKKNNIRVVTANDFITAKGLKGMSLKARKLLYIAISQCEVNDDQFYEYSISVSDFAKMMGVDANHVYETAKKVALEVGSTQIMTESQEKKHFRAYPLFQYCEYTEGGNLTFQINKQASDLFLNLKSNFSQPLLDDFLKFRSPMTMAIWHLMQREMKSMKPGAIDIIDFELSLDELRKVTGTEDKYKQMSEFKSQVLDKAIKEINDQCGVTITYTNKKEGKKIIGFDFEAISWYHIDESNLTPETLLKARRIDLVRKSRSEEGLTASEKEELEKINLCFGYQ